MLHLHRQNAAVVVSCVLHKAGRLVRLLATHSAALQWHQQQVAPLALVVSW
jgi:hypothetical protein